MEPVLELAGVEKSYGEDVKALRGVDLAVERGELAAIVGPSGSGSRRCSPSSVPSNAPRQA